jgi:hypothetical protein
MDGYMDGWMDWIDGLVVCFVGGLIGWLMDG